MASVLLRLGILFAIAVTYLSALGQDETGTEYGEAPYDYVIDPGITLIPRPHRLVVQKRTPLLLNCSLNITDPEIEILNYVWQRDGIKIDTNSHSKTKPKLFSNGSLLIYPRRKKSEGRRRRKSDGLYECIVNLSTGSLVARRVEVVIASIALSFTQEPSSQTAYKGGVARFECSIKAEPRALYVWHKDDEQLQPLQDERFEFLPSGVLHILDVKASDAGQYWCQAGIVYAGTQGNVNNMRWRISRRAELEVLPGAGPRPPFIVAGPKNITVEADENVYLECLADGWPRPKVTWKKKSSEKGSPYHPQNLSTTLSLRRVTSENAGTYECIVSAQGVTRRASAFLNVTSPPKITKLSESWSFQVARTTKLECQVEGNPPANITWYFNGKDLALSEVFHKPSKQSLTLFSMDTANSGYYQCIANNSAGQVIGSIYIDVFLRDNAPEAPENVKVGQINSTTALVTWDDKPYENPFVLFYAIEGESQVSSLICQNIAADMHHSCLLKNLLPDTSYYVFVQAFSRNSAGERSEYARFKTLKDEKKKIFPVFKVENLQKFHSVSVSWQPLPDADDQVIYRIYYRTKNGDFEANVKVAATQMSYNISDLKPDTTYEVVVLTGRHFERSEWPWKSFHTAKANVSSYFTVKFVNSTSVMLLWDPPVPSAKEDSITGYTIELRYFGVERPLSEIELPFTNSHSHVLTRLDKDATYEVTLKARSDNGITQASSQAFRILDLQDSFVPDRIWAEDVDASSMLLKWSAVPFQDVKYEVCYSLEFETVSEICHLSSTNFYNLTDVLPYSRYELRVRAIRDNTKGTFSKNIIVLTHQAYPTSPVNLTVQVVGEGSVSLHWSPPAPSNGVITSYVIHYGKKSEDLNEEVVWKTITISGEVLTSQIDGLDKENYFFKVAATTIAGQGLDSEVKKIIPVCPHEAKKCKPTFPINSRDDDDNAMDEEVEDKRKAGMPPLELAAIIVGVLSSIVLILVLLFLWCRRRLCAESRSDDLNTSHSPICPANGHIPSLFNRYSQSRPGNGQAHHLTSGPLDMTHPESTTPMLQVSQNERSDSKGGNDYILTPNGVQLNGYVRSNQWHGGQALHHRYSGDLNHSHNSEEMQGLIKAMMASTDGRNVINGSGDTALMMSSLGDINHADHRQKTGDHSSEDSGTGCHRVGINGRGNGTSSLASSPGGSSEANSSLGRRHVSLEGGHWGDEMGGVVMDPATGTVIGMAFPPSSTNGEDVLKEEEEEEWLPHSGNTAAADEQASNDRDSGHGSEVKTHSMCANPSEEEHLFGLGSDPGSGCGNGSPPCAADGPRTASSSRVHQANDLPPPPPSPPCSPSLSPQQLSSPSSSSSRNKHSNKVPQTDCSSHRYPRTNRHHTPLSKLPPPPPPPPLSALSPPTSSHCPSGTAVSTSEDEEGTSDLKADSGSNTSGRLSQEADVVFSQSSAISPSPHMA